MKDLLNKPSPPNDLNTVMWTLRAPEWSTVEGRRYGDDGVDGGQRGQEQDDQQHGHVEVVGARSFEDSLLRYITAHDGPTLQIHGHMQSEDIQSRKAGRIKRSHPATHTNSDVYAVI